MPLTLKKAVKCGAKLRLALYGPAGSGKTYTALSIAREMAEDKRIAVIDTERGSASKYADIFDFDVVELDNFHPHTYIEAIKMILRTKEYSVIVIDSTTHEWDGSKGALELAGDKFQNWAKVTPMHNAFTDAMLDAPVHVIATMRAKEDHVMEKVEGFAKPQVRSVGIEPIQRKGVQYEFDVVGSLDIDNTLTIVKTRCSALHGAVYYQAGKPMADILKQWLDGAPAPERKPIAETAGNQSAESGEARVTEQQVDSIRKLCQHLGKSEPANMTSLSYPAAKQLIQQLTAEYKAATKPEPASNELLAGARQMYQRLGREVPKDLEQKSALVVKRLIEQMTGEYRDLLNKKNGHVSEAAHAPDAKALRMRCEQLGVKYDEVVQRALGAAVPDDNQTPEQQARMNRLLDGVAERQAKRTAERQAAS